ncbi:hypothetical protein NRK68_12310 [Streptomyces yangpuensis]|uniref:Lipoprotein n=1 Tax=Streptomyces yangpuensis TaxID=1648182 RepID=A0ABY5PVI0_9ACTN|nr:hypothetical protein [Streptomyces yangpuensis]UUY47935.1 hypothetical protein NRK68_12310 [Streptomyces yangpuensis]
MSLRIDRSTVIAVLAGVLTLTGCSTLGELALQEQPCKSMAISPQIFEKYGLPELPTSEEVQFCEGSDRDGFSAQLTFRSAPDKSRAYLTSLGMDPPSFSSVTPQKVAEHSRPDGEGWRLTQGLFYKWSIKAHDWNGQCSVDYTSFIQSSEDWDGRVYLAMYCQT